MTLQAVRLPGARRDVYVAPGTLFVPVAPEIVEAQGEEWSPPVEFRFGKAEDGAVELYFRTVDAEGAGPERRISRPASAEPPAAPAEPIPWNEPVAVGRYRSGALLDYNGPLDAVVYARTFEEDGVEVRHYCPPAPAGRQVGVDRERRLWRHEPKEER